MTSSMSKILQYHIGRLKNRDHQAVLSAIEELIKLGAEAEEALPALEELFRTNDDPVVKKAAQIGGKEIHKKVKESKQQAQG